MIAYNPERQAHPTPDEIAGYLGGTLGAGERARVEEHLGSCEDCLAKTAAAHEAVTAPAGDGRGGAAAGRAPGAIRRVNYYLAGAVLSFLLSFFVPRFFLQFLAAAMVLGIKWIVDARSTKMLIMIHDAWKRGGEKEASRVLERLDRERATVREDRTD